MPTGKLLIVAGAILIAAGLAIQFGPHLPLLGKLPGDIRFERKGFSFYFPLTSCLLASLVISLLFWLFRK